MDLHLTPVEQLSNTLPMISHYQLSLKQEILHQNLCQQIDWKHYYTCKTQTPFANVFQNDCSNGKVPKHETDLFIHVKGLLYKHVTDSQSYMKMHCPLCLCHREKAKVQAYPLQMTENSRMSFQQDCHRFGHMCETSSSDNKHFLTIIDDITG